MRFLDTNIILRSLAQPANPTDQQKQQNCFALFQRIKSGQEQVFTCEAVITEVLYNLCSPRQHNLSHSDAVVRFRPLLVLGNVKIPNKKVYLQALDLFADYEFLDIEDTVIIAHMERLNIGQIYSYDTDFDRVSEVERVEP